MSNWKFATLQLGTYNPSITSRLQNHSLQSCFRVLSFRFVILKNTKLGIPQYVSLCGIHRYASLLLIPRYASLLGTSVSLQLPLCYSLIQSVKLLHHKLTYPFFSVIIHRFYIINSVRQMRNV